MALTNIKNLRKKEGGFTIVELLIVIVIIGILAALVIVAYSGIQNRAKTTKSNTDAVAVEKKLEAYYADNDTGYPVTAAGVNAMSGISKLPNGVTVGFGTVSSTNTIQFLTCDSGQGFQLKYYDFSTTAASTKVLTGGTQVSCAPPTS